MPCWDTPRLSFLDRGVHVKDVMTFPVGCVDPEVLRLERLPCAWCGGEIDYSAEPGSAYSFIAQADRASHYRCAAVNSVD